MAIPPKYLLFVASYLYMEICVYLSVGFGYPFGFGFGNGFPPESVSGLGSGFDFGFRFWVHGDSTRSEPDPFPGQMFVACAFPGGPVSTDDELCV